MNVCTFKKVTGNRHTKKWFPLEKGQLLPGMQSTPRTMEEPVPMEENSVGASPPSQSHLQDLLVHASDTPASYKHTQRVFNTCNPM